MPKIRNLEIKGFRAYGAQVQSLQFGGPMAVIWAPNSQGKTSLAEAIEFLLTGKTVRREMVASAKREFAEALRNARLPQGEEIFVAAQVEDTQGHTHRVERRLVRDYTGRDPCQSDLKVDGKPADDLQAIGIRLSQPPLEAPVLMPHTLRYVVSTEPQKRSEYFKALLEVSDLEEIRDAIAQARNRLAEPVSEVSALYERCRSHPTFGSDLASLESVQPTREAVEEALREALARVLADHGDVPDGFDARLAAAKDLLGHQRARTFPMDDIPPRNHPSWGVRPEVQPTLEAFLRAKGAVDKEVARLLRLFQEVLNLPEIASAKEAVDCPICETPQALTPERVRVIREKVETNAQFASHRQEANRVLNNLRTVAQNAIREAKAACPSAMSWQEQDWSRHKQALEELLADRAEAVVPPWEEALAGLKQARESVQEKANALQVMLDSLRLEDLDEAKIEKLNQKVTQLFHAAEQFDKALDSYQNAIEPFVVTLKQEVDRRSGTEGWQDVIDLCESRESLLDWFIERAAYRAVHHDVDEAIREIDRAKAKVLDDKFSELGQEILRWWNLLRPDELTSFHGVERGGTGRRFVDLKARLGHPGAADSQGVLRDAVAVFSDSQLNCLGLAAFLARGVREGTGFVVLDDPVPASDEEHRAFFIDRVLAELNHSGIQVILLTHDERMWKDVQERYKHLDLDTFIMSLHDPAKGAIIENRSDTLDAMLARAAPYVSNPNPDIRKIGAQRLRDAAERFCKLKLVEKRQNKGDLSAAVSDYDGKTLGQLIPDVEPLLTKDSSHPAKLRVVGRRLNPGSHDHQVPPPGDLKQCLGDLKTLRKEYLP
ncbi:AAA family ATPase [Coriobacteriia bacterium Es71-Z0120]|uniref:AAA family ATPase n=1 Tax=Parvivirga hydrogeniphila TaxID=2939460 RepID=UPI002260A55E|nr:AAA family ATPase [Parvivirga hydrogeniphila]MCL4079013.1 AAA family ATPase [Parvivirga hydrogeniphila]